MNPAWRRLALGAGIIAVAALAGYVATYIIFPAPIVSSTVTVPAFRGATIDAARTRLGELHLRARVVDTVGDPMTPAGTIAWQSPAPETALPEGAMVQLGVSSGAPAIDMPDVTDLDSSVAAEILVAAGLVIGRVDSIHHEWTRGTVVSTWPLPGAPVHASDTVQMNVSTGIASIPAPNVVGATLSVARERIEALGLKVGALDARVEGTPGTVIAQRPAAGTLLNRDGGIDLTLSGVSP